MTQCWIRTSPYTLPMILESGRFKTQHETGSSLNASDDLAHRASKEAGTIVYGYLCNQPTGAPTHGYDLILNEYGTAAVRLNESIKTRTTFCIADSLYQDCAPEQYSDEAVPANLDEIIPYVEAQFHGGVSVADIEEVVFQVYEGQRESGIRSMMEVLASHNIPSSIHYLEDK